MDNGVIRKISYRISSNLGNKWGNTDGNSFTQCVNYGFHCADFYGTQSHLIRSCELLFYRILFRSAERVENGGKFLLCLSPKNGFSLLRFSRNFHLLNNFTWISSMPNLNQIGQEMWTVRVSILLHTQVQYGCHYFDFHNR